MIYARLVGNAPLTGRNEEVETMRRLHISAIVAVLCTAVALTGCPDPKQAIVINSASDNISSVDLHTGAVTGNLGGLTIGPVANCIALMGTRAYVVNSGAFPGSVNASVMVIDISTATVLNTIPFPDGSNPWAIAVLSSTKAYVTTLYGNNVTVIDPTRPGASAILGVIDLPVFDGPLGPVPAGPEGIVIAGGYAYTANTGFDPATWGYVAGSVSVIDTSTDTLVDADSDPGNGTDTPIYLSGINAQDIDVDQDGRIVAVCTGDYWSTFGVVDVIDPVTRQVTGSAAVGGSPGNISAAGFLALMGAGDADSCDLYVVKTDTLEVLRGSSNPLSLMSTSGWCTVGKIGAGWTPTGRKAYAPAGAWGAENKLFEISLLSANPTLERTFDLEPDANLPVGVGLLY